MCRLHPSLPKRYRRSEQRFDPQRFDTRGRADNVYDRVYSADLMEMHLFHCHPMGRNLILLLAIILSEMY